MSEVPTYPPGHPVARSFGCTCDPRLNREGEGAGKNGYGEVLFVPARTCKLHGETRGAA